MGTRTSVSISDDLRRRMDAVREKVNWSRIAVTAFEAELARIASEKKEKDMSDTIQRLRASRLEAENEDSVLGRYAGAKWAREDAEWRELQRVAEYWDTVQPGDFSDDAAPDRLVELLTAIDDMAPRYSHDVDDAWSCMADLSPGEELSAEHKRGDFVRGFIEGAVEIYREVSKQL